MFTKQPHLSLYIYIYDGFILILQVTYPIPEGTVITVLTAMNNVGALVFLGIPSGNYGTAWMNWLFAGAVGLFAMVLLFFFSEKTLRYDVDTGKTVENDLLVDNQSTASNICLTSNSCLLKLSIRSSSKSL